jgi:hypothetical protein
VCTTVDYRLFQKVQNVRFHSNKFKERKKQGNII